jgi:hypothetical protein
MIREERSFAIRFEGGGEECMQFVKKIEPALENLDVSLSALSVNIPNVYIYALESLSPDCIVVNRERVLQELEFLLSSDDIMKRRFAAREIISIDPTHENATRTLSED